MPLPVAFQPCVSSRVLAADSMLQEVRDHLECMGYTVAPDGNGLLISQSGRFTWLLTDFRDGILFRKVFRASDAGRARPADLLELANRINAGCAFVRTYRDSEGDLALDAWHPGLYERRSFGLFVNRLDAELRELMGQLRSEVDMLLV